MLKFIYNFFKHIAYNIENYFYPKPYYVPQTPVLTSIVEESEPSFAETFNYNDY